ncbi:hypothetical protein SBV1_260065 [Verrucomicrobia bacterium]|nr:hypothetical protein SBV1_260065 [Verrucomicrobiota bacterium]
MPPARMHFCVSAARVSLAGTAPAQRETSGARWPRKMGTNWFMPALVKSRLGESGSKLDEGTMVCPFDLKKSKNDWRISLLVMVRNLRKRLGERLAQGEGNFGRVNEEVWRVTLRARAESWRICPHENCLTF